MRSRQLSMRTLSGLALVLLGALFLLDTTDIIDAGDFFQWTPSVFILLGIWQLVTSGFRSIGGPLALIIMASIVQLAFLDLLCELWPLVLIAIGMLIIFRGRGPRGRGVTESAVGDVDAVAVMGGVDRRVTSTSFQGGRITAIMGGVNLDLRDAAVAQRPATLDITAIMGGVDLKVPADWEVRIDAMALLGGASDERRHRQTPSDTPPHLVITGVALMGGISIKE